MFIIFLLLASIHIGVLVEAQQNYCHDSGHDDIICNNPDDPDDGEDGYMCVNCPGYCSSFDGGDDFDSPVCGSFTDCRSF